jgi:hypothetical protein
MSRSSELMYPQITIENRIFHQLMDPMPGKRANRICSLVHSFAVCLRRDCPLQNRRTSPENSYLLLIELAPAWCALASAFDGDSWIAAIFLLVTVYCVFPWLVIRRIYQHLSARKQIEVKTPADAFLHWTAMTCAVQDIIASRFRCSMRVVPV